MLCTAVYQKNTKSLIQYYLTDSVRTTVVEKIQEQSVTTEVLVFE